MKVFVVSGNSHLDPIQVQKPFLEIKQDNDETSLIHCIEKAESATLTDQKASNSPQSIFGI